MTKNIFQKIRKYLSIALTVMTTVALLPLAQAGATPQITITSVTPANGAFDPKSQANHTIDVYYNLSVTSAFVKGEVFDCSIDCQTPIVTLFSNSQKDVGGYHTAWDGLVNGQFPAAKSYTIRITASVLNGGDSKDVQATIFYANQQPQDNTPPVLSLVNQVPNPSLTQNPSLTFSSNEAGSVSYFGACGNGNLSQAQAGNNTVQYSNLSVGTTYSACSIRVTDAANNMSNALLINTFTVQQQQQQDNTPPTLFLVSQVPNPSYTQNPSFTFNSSEAGAVSYFGGCTGNLNLAGAGNNNVMLNTLAYGTYSNCYIKVTDASSNVSQPLYLNTFTVQQQNGGGDTTSPVLSLTTPVPNPTYTQNPSFAFYSNEAGAVSYFGGCTGNLNLASAGNNSVTLNTLAYGTYSNCYIKVTDASGNVSQPLYLNTFTVQQQNGGGDTTPPTISVTGQISTPTSNHTPSFTFTSSEDGTLIMGGGCTASTTSVSAGTNYVTLNYLQNGTYSNCYLQVRDFANNTSVTVYLQTFVINDNGGNQTGAPNLTNVYATPNPFNPSNQNTTIYFTVDTSAYVTVQIMQGSDVLRTLADYVSKTGSGTYTYTWDGRDKTGYTLGNQTYTVRVQAQNSYGTDTESASVTISNSTNGTNDGYGTLISNPHVTNATFNPNNNQQATLCFTILKDNTNITVDLIPYTYNHNNNSYYTDNVVKTLVGNSNMSANSNYCVNWDGRDRYNSVVGDDVFRFRIKANQNGVNENAYAYTEVDTDGTIYGFPGSTGNGGTNILLCSGFTDVTANNPYCKAIEYLQLKGIFTGYSDGTFRPYQAINRAETTKVILLAIGISLSNYTNYTSYNSTNNYYKIFWDTDQNAWYTPYLRTAQLLGIISGYPDGSFRPTRTVNRVELLKIFLESTGINIPLCNVAPFKDTPVNADTRWYMDYVCYASSNNLMTGDSNGNFNPAAPMSRGDVANLFYQFYVRGMYSRVNLSRYSNLNYNNGSTVNPATGYYDNTYNNGLSYNKYY